MNYVRGVLYDYEAPSYFLLGGKEMSFCIEDINTYISEELDVAVDSIFATVCNQFNINGNVTPEQKIALDNAQDALASVISATIESRISTEPSIEETLVGLVFKGRTDSYWQLDIPQNVKDKIMELLEPYDTSGCSEDVEEFCTTYLKERCL